MTDKEFSAFVAKAMADQAAGVKAQTDLLGRMLQSIDLMNNALRVGGLARTPSRILARKFADPLSDSPSFFYKGEPACGFTIMLHTTYVSTPAEGFDTAPVMPFYAKIGKDLSSPFAYGGNNLESTPTTAAGLDALACFDLREFLVNNVDTTNFKADNSVNPFSLPDYFPEGVRIYTFKGNFFFTELKFDFSSLTYKNIDKLSVTIWGE